MDDLTAFLNARLDEEEALAKGPPGWKLEHWTAVRYKASESGRDWRVDAEPRCIVDAVARDDAAHIACHDPARALREAETDRRLLDEWRKAEADPAIDDQWNAGLAAGLRLAVQIRAARFSDHPDCRPEWKP